ncbi:ABC transporter permease [Mesoterricola silvestris]|uniref:FtsX-like permease family protein n=1 Tax=Mesoterricola silvestris TaxID=2927979 RepID=A0AA48K7G7_9BACT|nr:ABC transporter permease [Mesoterricola silvestris]BDU71854.1 hypothetical protein METEAL_10280 [Mesoterricola silvestris]
MPTLHFSLTQSLRSLARAPGFVVASCLTLSLGLAAALAAFGPAWDILGRPFDFRDSERIVTVSAEGPEGSTFIRPMKGSDFWTLRRELKATESLGACRDAFPEADLPEGKAPVRIALVTDGFFSTMGIPLLLGRDVEPGESRLGADRTVILEHRFWMRRYGGDPAVLGRTLNLDGVPHAIVGVLAPQRRKPWFLGDMVAFKPLAFEPGGRIPGGGVCWVFGRLSQGGRLAGLQSELDRVAPSLGPTRPAGDRSWGLKARGLVAQWRAQEAPALALTLAAGGLVLLLACANAAHLLLARNLARMREWGIRTALGSGLLGMGSIILTEAALLVLASLGLAVPLLAGLRAAGLLDLPPLGRVLNLPALIAALILALAGISALPMRWATRTDPALALQEGGTSTATRRSRRLRGGMAIFQVALAMALLCGAGMALRALERLRRTDLGYAYKDLAVACLRSDRGMDEALQRQLVREAEAIPGVKAAALSSSWPLVDQGNGEDLLPEGGSGTLHADYHRTGGGNLATLGLALLAGRDLEAGDQDACMVSRSFAERAWPGADPLGRRVSLPGGGRPPLTVVGVVGEARMSRLARAPVPALYAPIAKDLPGFPGLYLRTRLSTGALGGPLASILTRLDPSIRIQSINRLENLASREYEQPRLLSRQALVAAVLATVLAGVGLAGTLAETAARRRRDWGIRMALGAGPWHLVRHVLGDLARILAPGLALGMGLAWGLGRVLQYQFPGTDPADPAMLGGAAVLLALAGFAAGTLPALQVLGIRPAESLRAE